MRALPSNLPTHATPIADRGRDWVLPFVLVACVALQMTWLSRVTVGGAHLDLPLLSVISVGLLRPWQISASYGLATGLLWSYVVGLNTGAWSLSRLLIGAACGSFGSRFEGDHPFAPSVCAFFAVLFSEAMFYLLSPQSFSHLTVATWGVRLGGKLVLHIILAPLVHRLIASLVVRPDTLMFGGVRR